MKAATIAVLLACALSACEGNSNSGDTSASAAATSGLIKTGAPTSSPRLASPPTGFGVAGGTSATDDVSASDGAQARESAVKPARSFDAFQTLNGSDAAPAMVIRTGQAFIEVEKVDPAVLKIRQLAAQVGGYIANSSMSGGRDQIRQATMEVKIPAQRYDEALGSLSTIGKVETVN